MRSLNYFIRFSSWLFQSGNLVFGNRQSARRLYRGYKILRFVPAWENSLISSSQTRSVVMSNTHRVPCEWCITSSYYSCHFLQKPPVVKMRHQRLGFMMTVKMLRVVFYWKLVCERQGLKTVIISEGFQNKLSQRSPAGDWWVGLGEFVLLVPSSPYPGHHPWKVLIDSFKRSQN